MKEGRIIIKNKDGKILYDINFWFLICVLNTVDLTSLDINNCTAFIDGEEIERLPEPAPDFDE